MGQLFNSETAYKFKMKLLYNDEYFFALEKKC